MSVSLRGRLEIQAIISANNQMDTDGLLDLSQLSHPSIFHLRFQVRKIENYNDHVIFSLLLMTSILNDFINCLACHDITSAATYGCPIHGK